MAEAPDLSGKQIGRYRVLTLLGSGGMGSVYDAIDPALGRHVALKVLPSVASDGKRLQRFVQEAKAASALNHPHLVSIYEIGSSEIDGAPVHFIAMEKVDGKTLREILARGTLPLRRAIEVVAQAADAVAAAHSVGVVHRDLKPENMMVSSAGYAKVLDFGLAKLRIEADSQSGDNIRTAVKSTESGVILGTAGYMSPEQAQGKDADHRADIFAMGCILYEAVTGKRAFRGDSSVDTLHRIIYSEPEPLSQSLPNAPAELQRIIRKAMAKDPDERYQSAKDLALDMRALLREIESASSARPAVDGSPRRRATALAINVAAILIVVASVGLVLWRRTASVRVAPAFQQITARGNVIDAQISSDGRFVAFAVREERGQSLWLKQLATGQELQLIPPTVGALWGCAFTRDGSAIVYGLKTTGEPRGALYRVSTIGGHPERVLAGIDSAVSFSPDGKRMTWVRADFPRPGESALMIANSDGSGVRPLATRRPPELFAPIFFTRPSWSPDGKLIAASLRRKENPSTAKVIGFSPQSGRETVLSNGPWLSINALEWLPDGSGIVAIASREGASTDAFTLAGTQIWLLPYPSGEPRRITNDASHYREPSISADGTKLVAVAADAKVHLSRASVTLAGPPERISSGRYDGVGGVTELRDGRIIFTSTEGGMVTLWIMERDGTGRRQLSRDAFENRYPVPFSGGIAYVSTTPTESDVCLINEDGEGRRVIARGVDSAPIAVSPDGKSLVYSLNRWLWKISTDGSQRRQLTREIASNPSYSPSGDRIAFLTGDSEQPEGSRLVVMTAAGDKIVWSEPIQRQGGTLRWMPDGNSLLLLNFDTHNVWMYPLRGRPKQLTNFDDMVWSFDIAHDGKTLIVAQGSLARDAVLITGFR